MTSYELYYGNGGHGGPYPTILEAIRRARQLLIGCGSEQFIEVKERQRDATVAKVCKVDGGHVEITLDIREGD